MNIDFEKQILDELVDTSAEKVNDQDIDIDMANELIRIEAETMKQHPQRKYVTHKHTLKTRSDSARECVVGSAPSLCHTQTSN